MNVRRQNGEIRHFWASKMLYEAPAGISATTTWRPALEPARQDAGSRDDVNAKLAYP
jgi:hypothetical protein